MKITKLKIKDALMLKDELFHDDRGSFTELWDNKVFKKAGVSFIPDNACFSKNIKAGTLRGLHLQKEPYAQAKVVTCVSGEIYDVILDLRKDSSTFLKWEAVQLRAFGGDAVYIPKGCAHGFVTVSDLTVVAYLIEGAFKADAALAFRWNDPAFSISWPVEKPIISNKDRDAVDYPI